MKNMMTYIQILFSILLFTCSTDSSSSSPVENTEPDPIKIKYWYAGEAEISSYKHTNADSGMRKELGLE